MPADDTSTTQDLIRRLEDGITGLDRLLSGGIDRERWDTSVAEGWTPRQILAHVRASDEILTPRVYQMLVRDEPPLPAFDERRWCEVAGYESMPLDAVFARIAIRRYELVQLLRILPAEAWERAGIHEVSGRVTILQVLTHIAEHEEEHLAEIQGLLQTT